MRTFKLIEIKETKQRLKRGDGLLVDIRDLQTFLQDNERGSFHLTNGSLDDFIETVAFTMPLFVICYHGHSSKGIAQYLCEQGYLDVYSVEKGFQHWRVDNMEG